MKLLNTWLAVALIAFGAASSSAVAQDSPYVVRVPVLAAEHSPLTTAFDFGTVIVGTQPSRGFTFTNRSAKATTLGAVQAIGKARILDHNCTGTLLPNESCALTLGLLADTPGSNTGSVSVSHSQATAPDLYNLSATAVTSSVAIRFDESTVNYGNQLLRAPSEPRTLTLRNTGSEPAEITAVRFSKSTSHYVIQDNTCEGTLPAGGSCQLSVVFRPQSLGPLSASLSYVLEDGTVVNAASLLGTGVQGVPSWSASEVNFLDVAAGQESAPKSVTLTNTGLGTLGLSRLTLQDSSGEAQYFWISSTTCGASLLPGASCQVNLVFSAPDTAIRNAVLELQASGTTRPLTRVQVWARPVANEALLSVDPVSLTFGDVAVGQPKTLPLTLRSVGQAPVSVSAYAFSGANAADFTLVNPTECVGTLNPGMQCVVQVRVTPGAASARVGTLTLTHTANQPVSPVALSANGLLGELQVMPSSLTFAPTNRGATSSQTLELKNVGGAPLRISSLAVTSTQSGAAAMFSAANTCTGRDLAAGASCTLAVTYAPTAVATHAATLTVSHTGAGTQKAVPLNGSGTEPPAAMAVLSEFSCPATASVGSAATCTAVLFNPSTMAYTVTGVGTSSNTNFVPSFVGCASGATLTPGQSCTVRLTVTPPAAGTLSTTYRLSTTAGALAKDATVLASSPAALLTTASHGNVQIGASANATHRLVNSGSLPVTLAMPATLGAGSSAFSLVSHTCPATLAVGAGCDIVTRCAPTSAGTLTRAIAVASNAAPAISGSLTCQGLESNANAGLLTFSPNPVAFAGTAVGSVSPAVTVTVKNNNAAGAKAVSITGATFSGAQASAFSVSSSTCYSGATAGSLASGATCSLTLTAKPTLAGLNSGVLQLGNSLGAALQLPLSVTGQQASFSVTPLTQNFGTITAGAAVAARSYAVTNTGNAAGSLTSVLPASTSSPVFVFSHNCPASIAAGASCAVTVAINSTASAARTGAQTGSASVQFSQGPSISLTALANLQAAPVPAGTVGLSCPATAPLGVAFSCTARVTSTGTANLAVSSWAPTYQYNAGTWNAITASAATCSSTGVTVSAIPPGQFCTVSLTLTPNAAGTYTLRTAPLGTVAMTPAQASVTVQGPSLQLTTTNHPLTQVGTSTTASHTLTNNGPVSVTISAGTSSVAAITLNRSACTTLAPGQSCTVTTTCAPTAAGNLTSTLTLSGTPTVSATGTVACTAQTGSVAISPSSTPTTLAGGFTTSGSWTRLTNTGVGPVTIQAFYPATGWALVGNPALTSDCVVGKVLQASESCVFLESLTGAQGPNTTNTGTQRVRTSVGDSSWTSQPLVLKGLSFTPVTPFGTVQVGDNVTAVYSVTNQAPTPTAMSTTFAVTGTGLSVDSHTCPATLASGATCQVTLRLAAPATATTVSGTLSASTGYNALVSNQVQAGTARSGVQGSLSLSIPILAANATLTPGTNTPIAVGQSVDITHELRNDGSAPVRITSAATLLSTTQHTLVGGTCTVGASVVPGATCTIVTRFAPTVVAQGAVTLTLGTSVGARTASFTGKVMPQTDTSVTVLASNSDVVANETVTFTVTVRSGAASSSNIELTFGVTPLEGAYPTNYGPVSCVLRPAVNSSCSVSAGNANIRLPANSTATLTQTVTSGVKAGRLVMEASVSTAAAQDTNAANNQASASARIYPNLVSVSFNTECIGAVDFYGRMQCNEIFYRNGNGYETFLHDPDFPNVPAYPGQEQSVRDTFPSSRDKSYSSPFGKINIDIGADGTIYTMQGSTYYTAKGRLTSGLHLAVFNRNGTLISRTPLLRFDWLNVSVYGVFDTVRRITYFLEDHVTVGNHEKRCSLTSDDCWTEVGRYLWVVGPTGTKRIRWNNSWHPVNFVVDEQSGDLVGVSPKGVVRHNIAAGTYWSRNFVNPIFPGPDYSPLDYLPGTPISGPQFINAVVRGNTMIYAWKESVVQIDLLTGTYKTLIPRGASRIITGSNRNEIHVRFLDGTFAKMTLE
jgi:hypothetical protein